MILGFRVIMKALSFGLSTEPQGENASMCSPSVNGCKAVCFLYWIINGSEAGVQTYSQEGTQTPPAAQHYNFSPASGS